jgi:uncharacterized protein (DUF1800 family)
MSPEYWGGKPKTPLELVASTLRALGARPSDWRGPVGTVGLMGMPLYSQIAPTGYSNDGREWVNASSLLNRINFAFGVMDGSVRGLAANPARLWEGADSSSPTSVATKVAERIFGYRLSQTTWEAATRPSSGGVSAPVRVVSLMLASPEFQVR